MKRFSKPFKDGLIELSCIRLGADYQILISGGKAHIGASAVAVCYGQSAAKVNVSQIAVYGHKEDELTRSIALKLSKATYSTVAVTAGIHFDGLNTEEICQVLGITESLLDQLIQDLEQEKQQTSA